jgi:hypothetical protein
MTTTRDLLDSLARALDPTGELPGYLAKTTFYADPASTRYHRSYAGGLADHTLGVVLQLLLISPASQARAAALAALGHDLCKVGTYRTTFRNVKNERTNQWDRVACFEHADTPMPLGHGESSLWLLSLLLGQAAIPEAVALAISWHMGAWQAGEGEPRKRLGEACARDPLVILLQTADMLDTYFGLPADRLVVEAEPVLERLGLLAPIAN